MPPSQLDCPGPQGEVGQPGQHAQRHYIQAGEQGPDLLDLVEQFLLQVLAQCCKVMGKDVLMDAVSLNAIVKELVRGRS